MLAAVLCALFAGVAVAGAAPKIVEASYTNAVAYELKSLQWTHFYATFDQPVWAVLTVHDGAGREVARVFDGAVPEANKRFWFPSWNGKDAHGRHLPSSAGYIWKLRAVRGGQTAEASGRIAICKVLFTIRDQVTHDAATDSRFEAERDYQRYMIDGPANVYISATSKNGCDAFAVTMYGQPGATSFQSGNVGAYSIAAGAKLHETVYLRYPPWRFSRGMQRIATAVRNGDISYQITVLQ